MARVHGRAALPILARVFGAIGLVLLVVAAILYAQRRAAIKNRARADGTVVSLHHTGRSYHPVVRFGAADGTSVGFEGFVGSSPPAYHIGETVGVLYDPANPSQALIDSFWSIWFLPMLFMLIGSPFAILGAGFFIASSRARR